MADAYWRDSRSLGIPAPAKRARGDLPPSGISGGRDISGYLPDVGGRSYLRESNAPGALDSHVRNGLPYSGGGLTSGDIGGLGGSLGSRLGGSGGYGGLSGSSLPDSVLIGQRSGIGSADPGLGGKLGSLGLGYQRSEPQGVREPIRRPEEHLPSDASNTLFVEGLPTDCTRREAAHIFRPFIGFKEVRLVQKEPRRPGGEPLVLCFVDFSDARCAATALEALQDNAGLYMNGSGHATKLSRLSSLPILFFILWSGRMDQTVQHLLNILNLRLAGWLAETFMLYILGNMNIMYCAL